MRSHLFRSLLAVAAAAALAAGCASSDLSKDTDTTSEVKICLPPGTPEPTDILRAVWFPNANGYGAVDASPVHVTGVLVLAGDKLWFMAWNTEEHHYDMLHDIAYLRAERIFVDRFGTGAMLVVQSSNDSYDSFQLMGKGQVVTDPALTKQLGEKLQALKAKAPATDP